MIELDLAETDAAKAEAAVKAMCATSFWRTPEPATWSPMKARVTVMLKSGVLDPQGEAVRHGAGQGKGEEGES